MSMLLVELCEKLKELDEITLMERLKTNSEELVERYIDVIEENYDSLIEEFDEPEEE